MPAPELTTTKIIDAAEQVLRRHGLAKATVVDVAKVLHVTHGAVYGHFASKAALREAVAARWLDAILPVLEEAASGADSPVEKLRRWMDALIRFKHRPVPQPRPRPRMGRPGDQTAV